MTTQAKNSLELYKGNNPETIKRALALQKPSVVKELMDHFGVKDIDTLSVRLGLGH